MIVRGTPLTRVQLIGILLCAFSWQPAAAQTASPAPAESTSPAPAESTNIDADLLARANAGDAAAEVEVGEHYAKAAATEHSRDRSAEEYKLAADWYLEAASQKPPGPESIAADLHLAELYRDGGNGFPRDMAQAAAWYTKAAEQGDVGAQGTLGVLYSMGQGVPHDDVEAYFWFDLAASVKGPSQQKYAANRQMIGERITADELAGVQDRVAAWKAAHPQPETTR